MNSCKLIIICPRHAKFVRNPSGMFSSRQLRTNANGKYCCANRTISWNFLLISEKIDSTNRCRNKIHKEHVDNNDPLAPCKLHHDPHSAREMLLLASSNEDQKGWVNRLSKRIQKCGYKANSLSNSNSTGIDVNKISSR